MMRLLSTLMCALVVVGSVSAQEMPKPGPEHEKLKAMVGDWDATVKMAGFESKATSSFKMTLGGFHLVQEFAGDFGGMKFEGRGTAGYCPLKKKYISTWTDSMSPSPMVMIGAYDADGKTFIEDGEGPGMDGKLTKVRSKTVMPDKDTILFTMFTVDDAGKETESMSITYKRKK